MIDRLFVLTGISRTALACRIMTYHAFGMRILRGSGYLGHLPARGAIVSSRKQKALICRILRPGIDYADAKAFIVLAKRRFQTSAEALATAPDYRTKVLANIYADYQCALRKAKQIDYDDQIFEAWHWLTSNPVALEHLRTSTRHIMVDEFQDTTPAQQALSGLVAETAASFVVVGDPNQSIFAFAGADPSLIRDFGRRFNHFDVAYLSENYRSTKQIITLFVNIAEDGDGSSITHRLLLAAEAAPDGPPVRIRAFDEPTEEVRYVLDEIEHCKTTDIALLFRTNRQIRVAEDECTKRGIPCRTVGTSFYARPEIRLILAFLEMIENPNACLESKDGTKEWAGSVTGRSGLPTMRGITSEAVASLMAAFPEDPFGSIPQLPCCDNRPLSHPHTLIRVLQHQSVGLEVSEQIELIYLQARLVGWLERNEEIDDGDNRRSENALELVEAARGFATRLEFLEFCRKRIAAPSVTEGLTLSTIHRAKGREWDTVFVCGVTEGLLPHKDGDPAEERRLLYVALSRAKRQLYVTCSGQPSEFWTLLEMQKAEEETSVS